MDPCDRAFPVASANSAYVNLALEHVVGWQAGESGGDCGIRGVVTGESGGAGYGSQYRKEKSNNPYKQSELWGKR